MTELELFRDGYLNRLNTECEMSGGGFYEEFLKNVSDLLVGAEEVSDDIHYCYYEGFGLDSRKKILIHGYSYNDYDGCLNLYVVTPPVYDNDSLTLTSDEITRYFNRCKTFITDADYTAENAEESHPAYGLAIDIRDRKFEGLHGYKLNIVSDRFITRNYKVPQPDICRGHKLEFSIIDMERIHQLENSLNGKGNLVIDIAELTSGNGIPCMMANSTDDYVSYLCNIPGRVLADIYNTYGSRLLEGNVRSFLQKRNKVNAGIRQTILKEPDNFFVYNNGITATASDVEFADDNGFKVISKITDLQIVNGGQTTASLASCLLTDKKEGSVDKISKIFVPMKLTIVSYDKAMDLIPNIAKYANSQNKVTEADLQSNSGFHVKMEEISRRLTTPVLEGRSYGTYWFYERARGQYKQSTYKKTDSERKKFERINPRAQLLSKTDFAKYIAVKDMMPEIASLGGEKAFFKVNEKISSRWKKTPDEFNDTFYQEIVCIAILYKDVDNLVKKQGRNYKANINAYTVSLFLYLVATQFQNYKLDYKEIWSKQAVPELIHDELAALTDYVYEELVDENRPVENVTEWAKREICWSRMKNRQLQLNPKIIEHLISNQEYEAQQNSAKSKDREITEDQAMMEVIRYGSPNWDKLLLWNQDTRLFTDKEVSIIKAATNMSRGRFPTAKQCIVIIRCLDKARKEAGYIF